MSSKKEFDLGRKIATLADKCMDNGVIDPELFVQHKVNKGLRDPKGKGVLTGLTNISDVIAKKVINGEEIPCEGQLYYRGYNINSLCADFLENNRHGFEEITYLLLFGELPKQSELDEFKAILAKYRKSLPNTFVRDIIMKAPSNDMMNSLARSVLTLYSYDAKANDTSLNNVLSQCLQLIALFPLLSVYSYQAYEYYIKGKNSFFIHAPKDELSTAENILHMLRIDSKYSKLEAKVLDLALVLHAEHGGGNNSTFTARAVTSSGSDTYSAISAAIGSLKGPKHGGANIKVSQMFSDIKKNVADWNDDEEIENYLNKILNKEVFDKSGLIYGIGHAVYSLSDPRALLLKKSTKSLSEEKGLMNDFTLYSKVEEIAIKLISKQRRIFKGVSANIDFYSGFIYDMLGLPQELYTPIFAIARISGWSAHRMEELINSSRIMRPAYNCTQPALEYVPMKDRK
ncbi:MAG: citrate/2-methylcitrate synthase [Clostridia bacterium]|nr:citrate/2-methylcitrate synthase [Clostridia bacterium]MDE6472658.1 citrate/2-methylcitrate synthase [Clostridia bacterium]